MEVREGGEWEKALGWMGEVKAEGGGVRIGLREEGHREKGSGNMCAVGRDYWWEGTAPKHSKAIVT